MPSRNPILNYISLPDFSSASVLVCGDLILDRYWYGDTSRISPEAPVPVVHIKDIESRPGGAANVALNIASLGGKVTLVGFVGDDIEADELESKLLEFKVDCALLRVAEHPTITKLRVLSQNQQLIRLDFEKNAMHGTSNADLLKPYQESLHSVKVVVLSDYAKGTLKNSRQLIGLAKAAGIPVLVDPKSSDFSLYTGATLITPNLKEFEAVVGHCSTDLELIEKARSLIKSYEIEAILVTRGKEGMILIQEDQDPVNIPTYARDVYDVTGAGDTVIGVLAAVVAAGASIKDAVIIANLAAGLVVAKLGAATVSVGELHRALDAEQHLSGSILTESELLEWVKEIQAHGEKVVMTNGCFDVLHAGHCQYLHQAKILGTRLIVAVNDDASVAQLKGPTRPLNPLQERMEVLASLSAVDVVVSFSEETPRRLIEAVKPDILVKGGDYKVEEIAGASSVLERGGEVIILDFKDGCSTTGLVNKIKRTE